MEQNKAVCPCCNGNIEIVNGKLIGHDRTDAGYCEGGDNTPEELKSTGCSEAESQ